MDLVETIDLRTILFFQGLGTWLYPLMVFISIIGNGVGAVLFSALLIWGGNTRTGVGAGLVSTFAGAVNGILKLGIRQPRPYWVDSRVQGFQPEGEFGMPSGHGMWSTAFWGYFARSFRRVRYLLLALGMILIIGISRVYLGVHSPSQVFAGWIAGAAVLAVYGSLERPVGHFLEKRQFSHVIYGAFTISVLLIGTAVIIVYFSPEFQIPDLWTANAKVFSDSPLAPVAVDSTVQSAALFFGWAAGALWSARRKHPAEVRPPEAAVPVPMVQRVLKRSGIGIAGFVPIFAVFYPLAHFTATVPGLQESILYVQYTLLGLWITAGAPALFLKLGLTLPAETRP